MATHNKPIHTIKEGAVKGSIWRNATANSNFYNLTVVRSYKNAQDQWKDSTSFGWFDMHHLQLVVLQAHEWMRRNPVTRPSDTAM